MAAGAVSSRQAGQGVEFKVLSAGKETGVRDEATLQQVELGGGIDRDQVDGVQGSDVALGNEHGVGREPEEALGEAAVELGAEGKFRGLGPFAVEGIAVGIVVGEGVGAMVGTLVVGSAVGIEDGAGDG